MKLITAAFCATLVMTGNVAFGQIGETLQQCIAKYGPVVEKPAREWHKFESKPYHLEIHFYKANADAVQYLNWVDRQKAFNKGEIETLLKQCSTAHWEVVDDSPESTMFVVKGFTAIHMKLDHILIVATDGYLERGLAAKAAAEAGNLNWVDN
jgi:soluble cytochrome b562